MSPTFGSENCFMRSCVHGRHGSIIEKAEVITPASVRELWHEMCSCRVHITRNSSALALLAGIQLHLLCGEIAQNNTAVNITYHRERMVHSFTESLGPRHYNCRVSGIES